MTSPSPTPGVSGARMLQRPSPRIQALLHRYARASAQDMKRLQEQLKQAANDNEQLQQRLADATRWLASTQESLQNAQARVQELEPEVKALTQELTRVKAALPSHVQQTIQEDVRGPSLLTQILDKRNDWKDRLEFLPGALKTLRNAAYAEPEHVMYALEALATAYPAMRAGELTREKWSELLKDRLIEDRATTATRFVNSSFNDPLYVKYNNRRVMMDRHLCRGNSSDPKRCMRIYFFWDAQAKKVIVGHLPSHLPNSLTDKIGL